MRVKDGVVLAVEKPLQSKLLKCNTNRRIQTVETNAGMVGAGLVADCRVLANRAREECSSHRATYATNLPGPMLAERVALFMQAHTMYPGARPFCSAMLVAAVDDDGPHLFMLEPSGTMWGYRACAAGRGRRTAKTELEKLALEDLSVEQAVVEAAKIIYLAHDEHKDKDFELEISWIGPPSRGVHQIVPKDVLAEATRIAKENLASLMDYD